MRFIEKFEENVRNYPDKVILKDSKTSLTFDELDEISGRVYAYLRQKSIGKEDFVMICLPRGVKCYEAFLGVWKAGAAFVLYEDDIPEERADYIYKNCGCCFMINNAVWEDIIHTASMPGHEESDVHDAAFALYTSGSTGTPKGVLHEFGKIELITDAIRMNGEIFFRNDDIYGHPLPLYTTGSFVLMLASLQEATLTHILPYAVVMDPTLLEEYVQREHITITGLVPTLVKKIGTTASSLRTFITGGGTVQNFYLKECPVLVFYGQTETAMTPHTFVIDRPYDSTPIGSKAHGCDAYILDEVDNVVGQNEAGELCYTYDYTRGYINDPELTSEVYRNGLCHTGDIVRQNEDGNYVILGRKTDMIKINGNRIEPAEIEAAVKRVLGIDWAYAKGFVQPERSFICVYYTAHVEVDLAHTRQLLLDILPTYMIPSYFIHIDSIPHLPNGKVDRRAFPAPDIQDYMSEYVAPANELEERICHAMQQVLGIERIGTTDDFYLLGGDSLRTIRLVAALDVQDISVPDIYAARTPAAIAERWFMKQMV